MGKSWAIPLSLWICACGQSSHASGAAGASGTAGSSSGSGGSSGSSGTSGVAGTNDTAGGAGGPAALAWSPQDAAPAKGGQELDAMSDGNDGMLVVAYNIPDLLGYSKTGWSTQAIGLGSYVGAPQIAGPPASALVSFHTLSNLSAARRAGTMFGASQAIGTYTDTASEFDLLYGASSGTAIAYHTDNNVVYAAYFDGSVWQPEVTVASAPNSGIARVSRGVMDAQGRAVLLWQQADGANTGKRSVVSSSWNGSKWSDAAIIGDGSSDTIDLADVAVNAQGKGFGAWGNSELWVCPLDLASGWGTPSAIQADSQAVEDDPAIAVNDAGQAVLVWQEQFSPEYVPKIQGAFYDPQTGWGAPHELATRGAYDNLTEWPSAVIDASGRAVVAWRGNLAAHFTPASGWGQTVRVDHEPDASSITIGAPRLVLSGSTVFMLWYQNDASGYAMQAAWAPLP